LGLKLKTLNYTMKANYSLNGRVQGMGEMLNISQRALFGGLSRQQCDTYMFVLHGWLLFKLFQVYYYLIILLANTKVSYILILHKIWAQFYGHGEWKESIYLIFKRNGLFSSWWYGLWTLIGLQLSLSNWYKWSRSSMIWEWRLFKDL
jgi:hypothetical protein